MNLLIISFIFDIILLVLIILKSKNILQALRFAAFSSVINLLSYCISNGLSESFNKSIMVDIICTVAAKVFVFYVFITFAESIKTQKLPEYLMVTVISLCVYNTSLSGILCGTILLVYLLYLEYSREDEIKNENPNPVNENSLYLKTVEENYRKSRALLHDFNNHIVAMRSLTERKQYDELEIYINSLSEKIASSVFPVKSRNIVLDALIADKYQRARRADIYIEFEKVDYRNAITNEDLCVIIGNLFDNAIEENLRSSDKDNRYIKLYISSIEDRLVIRFRNPLHHELIVKSGLPSTIKPDIIHHGIGLKNVRRICGKYNGELIWTNENNIFEITVQLIITPNL